MDSQENSYSDPYLIYLDQNIIDDLVKERYTLEINVEFNIVCSPVNFDEIQRMEESYRPKYLKLLKEIDALYLHFSGDKPRLTKMDPFEQFEEFKKNTKDFPILNDMNEFAFKMFGGNSNFSFEEIIGNQEEFIKEVIEKFEKQELSMEQQRQLQELRLFLSEGSDELKNVINEFYGDENEINPKKDLKNTTGLSALQLNNIEPPNVIDKIFVKFRENSSSHLGVENPEEYFNWERLGIDEDDLFSKINAIFNFLNLVDYYPDSKIDKKDNFNAAMSDSQHASWAAYTDCILTKDKSFCKRLKAVYDYLNISTQVELLKVTDT